MIYKKNFIFKVGLVFLLVFCFFLNGQEYIADYEVSKESVLRSIPVSYIEAAKNNLHIMYCGTSHSSQVVDGMRGLMEYKTGDNTLFAVTFNGSPVAGALDIHYRPSGVYSAYDLSHDSVDGEGKTGYYYRTIEYLDNPVYSDVNVVMWSWCSIEGHDVQIYLDNFAALIDMYRAGGSKGRTAANEVKFVFMTGYARGNDADTPEPPYIKSPYQNHKRIVDYCRTNGYFCLDYWTQDTYEYETDAYKPTEDGNTNVQHKAYTDSHVMGEDWYQCRSYNSGSVSLPAHANQHLTGNRRAYGAWWIWARLAGWNGVLNENVGKPDFNDDGIADIIWRYHGSGGYNTVWLRGTLTNPSSKSFFTSSINTMDYMMASPISDPREHPEAIEILAARNSNWILCGCDDFNKDGKTDLLWRNSADGRNAVWFMNGLTRIGASWLPTLSSANWKICGIGDFNNDGMPDLVWRHMVRGKNAVWFMDGVNQIGAEWLPIFAGLNWELCGVGDFNNDGKSDLVWRNIINGKNAVWFMDGVVKIGAEFLPIEPNINFKICGISDFNNDGQIDLLLRNDNTGENKIWYMNGIFLENEEFITTVTDTNWAIEN